MDLVLVMKLGKDLVTDEPMIAVDIPLIRQAIADMRALPPVTNATSFVAYAKKSADALEVVAIPHPDSRSTAAAAHSVARHPTGLDRRLDLPVAPRPSPGHRARCEGAQAVPLPPTLAAGARRGQV